MKYTSEWDQRHTEREKERERKRKRTGYDLGSSLAFQTNNASHLDSITWRERRWMMWEGKVLQVVCRKVDEPPVSTIRETNMKRLQEYLIKKRKKENEQKLTNIKNKLSSKFFGSQKKPYEDEEVKSTSRFALANEEVSELCANNNGQIPTKECIQELTKISAIHPTVQNQSGGYYEIHRFTRSPDSSPSGYICDFIIPILTAGPRSTFCYALFTLPLSISEVLSSKISLKPIIKEIVKLSSKITVSKLKWIDTNSNEEMNNYWKNMYTKQATPQEEKEKEDGINESESSCKTTKVATVESQISNGGASRERRIDKS